MLEQPYTRGMGKKGMIGVNQTQHIMKNILKNNTRFEDPREAILKYANAAEGSIGLFLTFLSGSYMDCTCL